MARVVYAKEGLIYTSATVPNLSSGHIFSEGKKGQHLAIWASFRCIIQIINYTTRHYNS